MVNVYCEGELLGRVKYNNELDFWDGHNFQNGGAGYHKGITKLKKYGEPFVIIEGSDHAGDRDYAYTVEDEEALIEIIKSDNLELLERKKFARLKKMYEEKYSDIEDLDGDE